MKYVVVLIKGKEELFPFPRTINHDRFCEVLSFIKHGSEQNWRREYAEPVSAGFISYDGKCYGESETLRLMSRGDVDTTLFRDMAR